ncbi:GatB/YqeY domain-containing protein [Sporormia fimetaria CBS 119925]|uniref:Altered inheritance of mitochondria protein 41 n=1 Tax=Sporormia fimetaria CBS 119925 TaxID=1340428 RepID=A0A6A6UYT4_9PLEO|nr:GatB/YqeY domain-containing protein [Sporormia fimetaria CBS 119925]
MNTAPALRASLRCAFRQPTPLFRACLSTSPILRHADVFNRLKSDLKDAMRAKDKARLNVLRSLMAEITNASKAAKPIDSDSKLLALLKKQIGSSEKAIAEFESAKRAELVEKERGQMQIMQGYVNEIPVLSKEEVDSIVDQVMSELRGDKDQTWKPAQGALMKGVMAKIAGKPVDQSYVVEKTKSAVA